MADETPFAGFITLEQFKAYQGITGTAEDARLNVIIPAVNASVNKYIGRTIEETEYEDELYDGSGIESLCLRNFPVSEITSITVYDIDVPARDDSLGFFGYGYYMKDGGEAGIVYRNDCWPRGRGIIKVSYTAGYATIPDDLIFATLQMAAFYRNVTKKPGIASEWLGSYSISLMQGLNQMNGELTIPDIAFKMVFDRYRVNYHSDIVY